MFKTNSRKGLSLAAIVALAASLLTSGPANAAGEVNLEVSSGSTYAALAGTQFTLNVNTGATIPGSSIVQLKTKITNTGGTTYSATISPVIGTNVGAGNVNDTKSGTVLYYSSASSTNSAALIKLQTATSVSDAILTLQSWLDSDFDNVIDADEFKSPERVVTFYKESAVTWSTAFTAVTLGNGPQTLSASVTSTQGINQSQLATGVVKVAFATVAAATYTSLGAASHSAGVFNNGESTSAVVATNAGKAELSISSVVASTTYVAVAVVNGLEVGTEQYSVVGAAAVTNIDAPTLSATANTSKGEGFVRVGATSIELTAAVSKSAGVKAAAGTLVKVTVAESSLSSSSVVTGGGKSLSNASSTTSEKIEFTVAVDADGKVTVPLTLAGMKNNQSFTVKLGADSVETAAVTITMKDTAYGSIVDTNVPDNSLSVLKVTSGTSVALKWVALDNFKQPLAGDYRFYISDNRGVITSSAALTAGSATFNVSPTSTTLFTVKLQEYDAATLTYGDVSGATDGHTVTVGTINAPAAVSLTANSQSNLVLNNSALKAVDTRTGGTAPTLATGNIASLSGQVTDANGIATYGTVTLTAPNVMFKVGSVYSLGSATVPTTEQGAFDNVLVYSNTAGKVTVSAKVGTATKDIGLTFLAAAETAGAKWVLSVPAYVAPGSTGQVKAQLLDTWSNPVKVTTTTKISVTYTGPGFVTGTLPNTTDADGFLSFSVLFGSADTGTATVKFAYDGDSSAATTADNYASSATLTVGKAPVAPASAKLTVGSFKGFLAIYASGYEGKKLSYKVAGKWGSVASLKAFERVVRKTGAGYTVKVDLYVDGSLVKSETITTK